MIDLNAAGLPAELTSRKQWLGCTIKPRLSGGYDKVPVGKWGDRQYWRTFQDVIDARQWPGFIAGDGVCTVDFDHCLDAAQTVDPLILDLVMALDTYTEISVSRHGLHAFAFGGPIPSSVRQLEIWSEGHWIAMTGQQFMDNERVEYRPAQLLALTQRATIEIEGMAARPKDKYVAPTHILKGHRRHELFRLLRHLKGSGLTREQTREIIGLSAANVCDPPWIVDEAWFARSWDLPDRPQRPMFAVKEAF